ncbi:MAG: helix-turn-helix domain-containing protein [Armatimonadota bacterium]|nr:helix-turn-helix domain-containing protein [Armatimonadota bacterium]
MDEQNQNTVTGDNIEPDESRTPTEFARDEWMTVEQVAKHFGVPAARVREWIAAGMLTPEPSGSIQRIRRSELNKIGNPDEGAAKEFEKDHGE